MNKRKEIDAFAFDKDFIDKKIERFIQRNGVAEDTLNRLFKEADNTDFDNVFCRVACVDLIYGTQIQRFGRGGIVAVTNHINNLSSEIDRVKIKRKIDFELYHKLVNVDYSSINNEIGKEQKIHSFVSKFLSFTLPDVYPIMDIRVKSILGILDSASYEFFYDEIKGIKEKYLQEYDINMSLKQWDMFLWQWEKDLETETIKK